MSPEDAARTATALDDRPPMRGPGWSEFMDEPEPVDDHEDLISSELGAAATGIAYGLLFVSALFGAAVLLSGGAV